MRLDFDAIFRQINGMDTDERDIFKFLKTWGTSYTAVKEIARRAASKKKFHDDPEWARPILMRMEERGILESDIQKRYRIKPVSKKIGRQWVSPDIAKILQEGGVAAGGGDEIADDDYYEQM
jgi:hypothetical protein